MIARVFTLGCKMNEVESASLMQGLKERGYEVYDTLGFADLYLLNTCAVTAEAEKKSRQAVARMRKYNPNAKILVCGCASHFHPEDFARKQGVTVVTGAQGKQKLLSLLEGEGVYPQADERTFCELPTPVLSKTRAFLRIQDGCNNFCSYCIIPYLRGRTRSRSAESVLKEAQLSNAKEIVLTGIDISSYRSEAGDLGDLLAYLGGVSARIRLGSLEVGIVSEAFLQKMKAAGNVVPHFHLSLQSGSTSVLKKMNRHYTREEYLQKCKLIYEYFPDAAITTDIIVGFPTETEKEFCDSLSIVEEAQFAHVHAFPFSARAGTAAAKLLDLPASVKKERMARLTEVARRQEEKYLARFIGKEAVALFEEEGGYTENYIRVYCENAQEGALCRVKLLSREREGLQCEILEVIS